MSNKNAQKLNVVIVGHVDHGKSTLIGRLLHDTNSLEDGKLEDIKSVCARRGVPFEYSFVLDAFQAERDQAVTIDTTQIFFSTDNRDYVIIDAPGHREFLKNMISGAAQADAAVLVVDADEGVKEQTRRHAYMLHLLGMKQIAVAVNKMDKVGYDPKRFDAVSKECAAYLQSIGLQAHFIIPMAARDGDMLAARSDKMQWYKGKTLIEALDSFDISSPLVSKPLRFPIQDVYRFEEKRILVGRVETGVLHVGDTLFFSPTNEKAVVTSIESWPQKSDRVTASAGQSIGITLSEPIFVERGHVASHEDTLPVLSNVFQANIFWLSEKPMKVGNTYRARFGTNEVRVSVQSIDTLVDTQDLGKEENAAQVVKNAVAQITLRSRAIMPIDGYVENTKLGRLVIYEDYDVVGGGLIDMSAYPDQRKSNNPKSKNIYKVSHSVTPDMRAAMFGHYGGIFWLTGLSGSGKSTLAIEVERTIFERGKNIYVLDGDNVRHGLNSDLGFSPEDRTENIRRVGEVAALQANAGIIVLSAFISPYQADRDRARRAAPQHFHEIYVKADLKTCEARDPKGLYKKARSGEIKEFTGIDSPYEPPHNPDLVVDTAKNDVQTCVTQIVDYIEMNVLIDAQKQTKGNLRVLK
ncbi:MAG: adenylyl-sulfate kinase [Alphaproteobacteria bacterium]|nr:adenylyl-sulfate kinase [Alphaproteobacteria bacterium]NCQ88770.1 adenylyl-sulfate kinase [Alphaproteobacteria bacterium]NCT07307.1 adenylyl-sulfate kinase [Alphaproteobacteria bacterium]